MIVFCSVYLREEKHTKEAPEPGRGTTLQATAQHPHSTVKATHLAPGVPGSAGVSGVSAVSAVSGVSRRSKAQHGAKCHGRAKTVG